MHLLIVASMLLTFSINPLAQPPFGQGFPPYSLDYGPQQFRPSPPPHDYVPGPFSRPPLQRQMRDSFSGNYLDQEEPRLRSIRRAQRRRRPESFDVSDQRSPLESFDGPDFRDRNLYQDSSDSQHLGRPRGSLSDRVDITEHRSFRRYPPNTRDRFERPRPGARGSSDSVDVNVPNNREQYSTGRNFRRNFRIRNRSHTDRQRQGPRGSYDIRRQLFSDPNQNRIPRAYRSQFNREQNSAVSGRYRLSQSRPRPTGRQDSLETTRSYRGAVQDTVGAFRSSRRASQDSVGAFKDSRRVSQDSIRAIRYSRGQDSAGEIRDSNRAFRYNPGRILVDRKHHVGRRNENLRRHPENNRQARRSLENGRIFGLISKQIIPRQSDQNIRYAPLLEKNRQTDGRSVPPVNVVVRNPSLDQSFEGRKTTKSVRPAQDPFTSRRLNRLRERGNRPSTARGITGSSGNLINREPVLDRPRKNLINDKSNTPFTNSNMQPFTPAPKSPLRWVGRQFGDTVVDLRPNVLIKNPAVTRGSRGSHGHGIRPSSKPVDGQNDRIKSKHRLRKEKPKVGSKGPPPSDIKGSNTVVKIKSSPTDLPMVVVKNNDRPEKMNRDSLNLIPKSHSSHSVANAENKTSIDKMNPVSVQKEKLPKNPIPEKSEKEQRELSGRVVEQRGLDVIVRKGLRKTKNKPKEPIINLKSSNSISLVNSRRDSELMSKIVLTDHPRKPDPKNSINTEKVTKKSLIQNPKADIPPATGLEIRIPKPTSMPTVDKQVITEKEKYFENVLSSPTKSHREQPAITKSKSSPNFDIIILNLNDSSIPADVKKLVPEGTSPEIIHPLSQVLKEAPAPKGIQSSRPRDSPKLNANRIMAIQNREVTKSPVEQTTTTKAPLDIKELLSLIQENKAAQAIKLMSRTDLSAFLPLSNRQTRGRSFPQQVNNFPQQVNNNNLYNRFNFKSNPYSGGLFGDNLLSGLMANKFFEGGLMEGLF